MDEVFRALADPSRRRLLDSLNARGGQSLRELCEGLAMTRQSVSKHLAVLEGANLITTVRRGREKLHYLNAAPINEISDRWIDHYDRPRVEALADLKRALEEKPMQEEFIHTSYIRSTPERVWAALTDPAFTARYWGATFATDWQPGSTYTFEYKGIEFADPDQVILEAEPYRRLSYTWHHFTLEWAQANGYDEAFVTRLRAERRSKVTFELEPAEETVKLTVLHDGFQPGSEMLGFITRGWPKVISGLKTLLETGEALPV